jgi:tetratricopeptide (TPR) repeat protein/predicted Ser/Thr protein kinase
VEVDCPSNQAVADFVSRTIGEAEAASIELHLDRCASCRELVSALALGSANPLGATLSADELAVPRELPGCLGRYELTGRLGAGAMGVVYAAHDPKLERPVALKLLNDSTASSRLVREGQALARLAHPNVVAVFDVGEHDGTVFIAMELVDGVTLSRWLRDQKRTRAEILDVFAQAGRGLAAAHAAGFVHRDFKPDNVLVGRDGRARVTDFGLARLDDDPAPGSAPPSAHVESITRTGSLVGTPAYMAPEQLDGHTVDARADQFAFCVALFEALTGERPFDGITVTALRASIATGTMRGVDLPPWIRRTLVRGLAEHPADRFPTIGELLAALDRDPTRTRRRVMLAAIATASVIAIVFAVLRLGASEPTDPCPDPAPRLAGVWDAVTKARARGAFVQTKASFAEDSWRGTERQLDAYTNAWKTMHRETCRATAVRHEQSSELLDLRMACLNRALDEVRALSDVFATANTTVVTNAVSAANQLARLDDCAHRDTLVASAVDPTQRTRVDEITRSLAAGKALWNSGRPADAVTHDLAVVAAARELGHLPTLARALLDLGLAQYGVDPPAAKVTLREAMRVADSAHLDTVKADALIWSVGIAENWILAPGKDLDDAVALAEDAAAVIHRIGGDPAREARRLHNLVGAYFSAGVVDKALVSAQQAMTLLEKAPGRSDFDLATAESDLGAVLRDLGRLDEAYAHHARAAKLIEATYGPRHPNVAVELYNGGLVLQEQGTLVEATHAFEQALSILEAAYGPDALPVAQALEGLGNTLAYLKRPADALPHLQRARVIMKRVDGEDRSTILHALGRVELALGHHAEARALHEQALAYSQKVGGPDDAEVGLAHANLGQLFTAQHDHARALPHFREYLRIEEQTAGRTSLSLVQPLVFVGSTLVELRRGREALPLLERAIAIGDTAPASQPDALATARALLGRVD